MGKEGFTIFDWLKEITTTKSDWSSFTEDQQNSFNSLHDSPLC
jgi:hypothetical protein